MTTNLTLIREALKGCEEISLPSDLEKNCRIKYITIKDDSELFYQGGIFKYFGNNKIILSNSGKTWSVPFKILHKDGSLKYKPRFFIVKEEETCSEEKKELDKIIQAQQDVIEKMTQQIHQLEIKKTELHNEKIDYETMLQKQRYELKEKDMYVKTQDEKIHQYIDVIKKLQYYYNSHPLNNH